MTKLTKVQMRPETTVKLMLKSFKIQTFADPEHHQGQENILCKACICYLKMLLKDNIQGLKPQV